MTTIGWWMTRTCATALVTALLAVTAAAQTPATITLAVSGRANSAPWVASHGQTVAVVWAAAGADKAADIFVATSHDGGASFGAPVQVNRVAGDGRVSGEIPPRVALYARPGQTRPDVVVAWNAKDQGTEIKLARSSDGGRTFATPVSLQARGAAGDRGWHALAVDEHGTAHVFWLDHRGLAEASSGGAKGDSEGAKAGNHHDHHDGVAMAQKSGLFYAAAGAGERQLAPGVCYCCKSAALALPGGTIVAAWRHVYADNLRDIAFTTSRDGGRTFAPIARVSEDGWSIDGCPDDGPALAAGAAGRVHVVWPTVIPGDEPTGALFHAVMGEGGFTPRTRIPTLGSPKPSHPQVAVDGQGRLFAAWDEILGGVRTAAFSMATAAPNGEVRFAAPVKLADGPTQYPVMAPLADGVMAAWTAGTPGQTTIAVRRLTGTAAASSAVR